MASTVVASGRGLSRGLPANLGTLLLTASVVQFGLTGGADTPTGTDILSIVTVGGTLTAALEASFDGGTTWFGVNPRAANGTAPNFTTAGAINGDTAVSSANNYDVSGMTGALFRFGSSAAVTGTPVVWGLLS